MKYSDTDPDETDEEFEKKIIEANKKKPVN